MTTKRRGGKRYQVSTSTKVSLAEGLTSPNKSREITEQVLL